MKKNLKNKISLGVLMACLITGNIGFTETIKGGYRPDWNIVKADDVIVDGEIGYGGKIELEKGYKLIFNSSGNGIYSDYGGNFNIIADDIEITTEENGLFAALEGGGKGTVTFGSTSREIENLIINTKGQGFDNKSGTVNIYGSHTSNIFVHSVGVPGEYNEDQSAVNTGRVGSADGTTFITGGNIILKADGGSGIITRTDNSSTNIKADNNIAIYSNHLDPETNEYKTISNAGINNMAGITTITSNNAGIDITSSQYGILAQKGEVNVTSYTGNTVNAASEITDSSEVIAPYYGSKHSIKAEGQAEVNMNAMAGNNALYGVIYAKDAGTVVTLNHNVTDAEGNVTAGTGDNIIMSSAHGSEDNIGDRSHVVAALYAQSKGKINVTAGEGGVNYIASDYTFEHEEDSEHTVWAQRGGIIEIKGSTIIKSSNAENYYAEGGYNTNSRGIAITAGSDEIITDEETNNMVTVADEDRSRVNLEYGAGSAIYGDIVSGYGGWVNVKAENGGSLDMQGNALAGNGGILNLEIADGSTWYGRADDYGDAGYGEDAQNKQEFYNPAFSNAIIEGGQVNVTMGEGSTWFLTGQSWVSSLDVSKGNGNVTIDMQEFNEGTHGLTIAEMTGKNDGTIDATFVMSLNHDDHGTSDMLYIKNGTGEYDVVLKEAIDGMENINADNVLRFATVQGGAQFNSVTMDNVGLYNLGFEIDHSEYDTAEIKENQGYNGASVDENKPGNENVEGFFDLDETAVDEGPSNIMLLADQNQRADDSVQNWFITRVSGQEISDAGKTVVAMSKANYSNAVYMDRLNKRLGEARYINNEEDQGMWVRLRHDRIGKSDEFRSMNTMYELGYDEKQECDNGERRVGAAIDYMDGSSEYSNVAGTGDISRKGIWLYDTWMGDKGHYADYVAKWGHLSNDFKLYRDGKEITGDYSNNVYSISAEYGRKKDIGNDWYFEPQVQLQYARVTGASYTTSQGTDVDLDAINSLIARAGFRLGKDLSERSTVYFKADVLHEFLGDQDIYAHDATGEMDVTYGNEGTWCDVGFGFAAAMSKTSYAYLDFEKSFGNDFDDTYQINAGLQWSF